MKTETLSAVQHYDKLSAQLMVLDKCLVSWSALLDGPLSLFDAVAAKKGVDIVLRAALSDSSELQVDADEPKLVVVLRNLLSNALKFTPKGGSVTVSKRCVDDATALAMLEGSLQSHHQKRQGPSSLLSRLRRRAALQSMPASVPPPAASREQGWGRGWGFCADLVGRAMRSLSLHGDAPSTEGFLLIEMTDTGVGMTPESCSRLFREVVQFDVNANQGGNGSGMGECIHMLTHIYCSILYL
jgi:signal transduction histidine kinase